MNNILFVDDESDILNSYGKMFKKKESDSYSEMAKDFLSSSSDEPNIIYHDYTLFTAHQGEAAVEIVKEQIKQNDPIKLAFVDMRMPPGIDGTETSRRLRELDENIEIVIVTAYSDTNLTEVINTLGQPDKLLYLKKPFDPMEIKQLAFNLIEKYNNERVREKFMANVTHELSTPLTSILGFSKLLNSSSTFSVDEGKYIETIFRNASIMKVLVDDLILASTLDRGFIKVNKVETSVNEILSDIKEIFLPIFLNKNDIEFIVKKLDSDVKINCDKVRIYQSLTNFLNNSLKFTEKGIIELSCYVEDESVVFKTSDTGCGISKEYQTCVFDRFKRIEDEHHNKPGMGIGLSITSEIANKHNGKVWLESEESVGSTFYLSIPLAA